MKKTISLFATLALVFSLSSFSPGAPISGDENVKEIFKTDFVNAASVTWTKRSDFYFADFTIDGRVMGAAYNAEGKLLATSRVISPGEVPADLLKRAEGNFRNGHSTPRVLEISLGQERFYYFNIITERFIIQCHADADGVITEESRMKLQK